MYADYWELVLKNWSLKCFKLLQSRGPQMPCDNGHTYRVLTIGNLEMYTLLRPLITHLPFEYRFKGPAMFYHNETVDLPLGEARPDCDWGELIATSVEFLNVYATDTLTRRHSYNGCKKFRFAVASLDLFPWGIKLCLHSAMEDDRQAMMQVLCGLPKTQRYFFGKREVDGRPWVEKSVMQTVNQTLFVGLG
jgi:hypothetical protein